MSLQAAVIIAAVIVVLALFVLVRQAADALVEAIDRNTQTVRGVVEALAGEDDELADERDQGSPVPRYFKDFLKSSPGERLRELAQKWREENQPRG